MSYRIAGLNTAPFVHLYGLTGAALRELGVQRVVAHAKPGYPDRLEMRDVEVGEKLLLFNHACQPAVRLSKRRLHPCTQCQAGLLFGAD